MPKAWAANEASRAIYSAVPSIEMVTPSGRTVEKTGFLMPRLASATAIDTGRVAEDEEVEKATRAASVTPRKKGSAGSRASSLISPPCTTSTCRIQPVITQKASSATLTKVAGPVVPITQAIRAKTPNGATSMTKLTTFSMASAPAWKAPASGSPLAPAVRRPAPKIRAKKITDSTCPWARALMGLVGTMDSSRPANGWAASSSRGTAPAKSTPSPGWTSAPRIRPMTIAIAVVSM